MSPLDPLSIPFTPEGREELFRLAEEFEAAGDRVGLGKALTRLSQLTKQIGTPEGDHAWVTAAGYGQAAVETLRGTGDDKALAGALRGAALPFIEGSDPVAMLNEAAELSRRCGDVDGEAWAYYALGNTFRVPGAQERAAELFKACEDTFGLACELQSRAMRESIHPAAQKQLFFSAIEHFRKSKGGEKAERRCCASCLLFCRRELSEPEAQQLLNRWLELLNEDEERLWCLRQLAEFHRRYGRRELAAVYKAEAERLIPQKFGSREAYLREMLDAILHDDCRPPRHLRTEERGVRIRRRRWEAELRRLRGTDVPDSNGSTQAAVPSSNGMKPLRLGRFACRLAPCEHLRRQGCLPRRCRRGIPQGTPQARPRRENYGPS